MKISFVACMFQFFYCIKDLKYIDCLMNEQMCYIGKSCAMTLVACSPT